MVGIIWKTVDGAAGGFGFGVFITGTERSAGNSWCNIGGNVGNILGGTGGTSVGNIGGRIVVGIGFTGGGCVFGGTTVNLVGIGWIGGIVISINGGIFGGNTGRACVVVRRDFLFVGRTGI